MASDKQPRASLTPPRNPAERRSRGRVRKEALFPVPAPIADLPDGYAEVLGEIKRRIQQERLRVVLTANSAMIQLYWDIGRIILNRQEQAGWGAKVVDRLAHDLRETYPDMTGISPRNLKYMRAFAAAWSDAAIVQRVVAQLPWRQNIALLERQRDPQIRLWYAAQTVRFGWSEPILRMQMDARAHARQGQAVHNFPATLPPADSDLASQVFKDPYLFDFIGTADSRREEGGDGPQEPNKSISGWTRSSWVVEDRPRAQLESLQRRRCGISRCERKD